MASLRARQLIAKNVSIPTLPAVVQKIQTLLEVPNTSAQEVGEAVGSDAPLAARVLKIANSAFYGLRERCLAPQHATSVLGVRVLRNVVTQAAVMSQYEHLKGGDFDLDEQWRHSIVVAQSCNFLGKRCRTFMGVSPDELYVCGLLHDLGKLVLLECLKKDYLEVARQAKTRGMPMFAIENEKLGFNHTDVGFVVAQQWGLPHQACSAIQHHHGPREALQSDPLAALVANVNLLVHRVMEGNPTAAAAVLDEHTSRLLGLKQGEVDEVVEFVTQSMATVEV